MANLTEIERLAQQIDARRANSVTPSPSVDSLTGKSSSTALPARDVHSSQEGLQSRAKSTPQKSLSKDSAKGGREESDSEEGAVRSVSSKRKTTSSVTPSTEEVSKRSVVNVEEVSRSAVVNAEEDLKRMRSSADLAGISFLFGDAVANYKWMRHTDDNYSKIRNLFWWQRNHFERFILTVAIWPAPRIDKLFARLAEVSVFENASVRVNILEEEIKIYLAEMKVLIDRHPKVDISGWFKRQESILKLLWQQDEPNTVDFNLPESFICKSTPTKIK